MGNTQGYPTKKLASSVVTSGKLFGRDEMVTCDRKTCPSCVENEVETVDETLAADNAVRNEEKAAKPSIPDSKRNKNSAIESDEEQRNMWEEVASKYQDILYRDYRMLNFPSYPGPVSAGNVYLYYVPVIINPQFGPQDYGGYDDYLNASRASDEIGAKNDVAQISDDNSEDNCSCRTVKEEPLHYNQTVKIAPLLGKDVKDVRERFLLDYASCKIQSKQCNDRKSPPCLEEPTLTTKEEKNAEGRNTCSIRHREDMKNDSECDIDRAENRRREDGPSYEKNVEVVGEGYIRIFKGYTIEYHPLNRGNQGCYVSEADRKRAEKIQDLKKRLAEQEEELEKLKLQQSVDLKDDVYRKGNVNGFFRQKFMEHTKIKEFQVQKPWKFLKEFPSTEIRYFPSGERETYSSRRNSRKQAAPRRIDTNKKQIHINGDVNCSVKGEKNCENKKEKRLLPQEKSPKRAKPSKKVKAGQKRRNARHVLQGSDKTKQKRPKLSMCKNSQLDGIFVDHNMFKARAPHDVTQDEFLSIFGLLRKSGQQSGTRERLH